MSSLIQQVKKQIIYHSPLKLKLEDLDLDKYLLKDFNVYGDDFKELIEELSHELKFDIDTFYNLFDKEGFYSPSESYLRLPKIFHINIGKLLKGKIIYQTFNNKGDDITANELIQLLHKVKDLKKATVLF